MEELRVFFLTVGRLLELGSLPANKTDETLLRLQTPVGNNEPGNIHEPASIFQVRDASPVSPPTVSSMGREGRKKNPGKSVSTARRSLTPCFENSVVSRQNSRGWKQASCASG